MSSTSDPGCDRSATPRLRPASLPYSVYPRRQFFDPNTPPVDPPAPNPKPADPPGDPDDLGERGKAALARLREEKRQEADARRTAETRVTQLEAAARKRTEDEAAEQGKFKELAETRLTELTTVTQDRDGLKAQVEALEAEVTGYRDAAQADYDAAFKQLPKDIAEMQPEGDLAARRSWLSKAQKLAESVGKRNERGNPSNPPASGPAGDKLAADATELARQRYGLPRSR